MMRALPILLAVLLCSCAAEPVIDGRYAGRVPARDAEQIKRLVWNRPEGVDAFDWAPVRRIPFDAPDRARVELRDWRVLTLFEVRKQNGGWQIDRSSIHTDVLVTS
jgi:hypothetical protein